MTNKKVVDEIFLNLFKKAVEETLAVNGEERELVFEECVKNNNSYTVALLKNKKCISNDISANVPLDLLYKCYLASGCSIEEVVDYFMEVNNADHIREVSDRWEQLQEIVKSSQVEQYLFCELVNMEDNAEYLAECPHRAYIGGLAICYRLMSDYSIKITNSLLVKLGMTEAQLFERSCKNVLQNFSFEVIPMIKLMSELTGQEFTDEEIEECIKNFPMWTVINNIHNKAANALLFPDVFKPLAEELNSDLLILPSSVHELIVLKADEMGLEEASCMVNEVNQTEVPLEERLSNQVFKYCKATNQILCVTDNIYSVA